MAKTTSKKIIGRINSENNWKKESVGEASSLKIELDEDMNECPDCSLNRANIAVCMMQSVILKNDDNYPMDPIECAELALKYTDALMNKLNIE